MPPQSPKQNPAPPASDEAPDLTTTVAATDDDLVAALQLIADSVAQQRQIAARSIIFHPLWLGTMAAAIAVVYQLLYHDSSDLALIGTTSAGCLMAGLVVVRALTSQYIELAEKVGTWAWLGSPQDQQQQVVLVSKFGSRVIGAVVLRLAVETPKRREPQKRRACVVRAWTVQRRYRRHGVGRDLLEHAVAYCQAHGWGMPTFDGEHAHSQRILPRFLNRKFEESDRWARALLAEVISARS